jgi:DNA-binding transcriptional LysR family regulator
MELDSSEAIVGMAKAGLGAGVVPGGRLKHVPADSVVVLPFGTPHLKRRVVLVERRDHARSDLSKLVFHALKQVSG